MVPVVPLLQHYIHLNGACIFPDEGDLDEFFDTLTAHSNHPSHDLHLRRRL